MTITTLTKVIILSQVINLAPCYLGLKKTLKMNNLNLIIQLLFLKTNILLNSSNLQIAQNSTLEYQEHQQFL